MKKLLALILAGGMLLSLVACNTTSLNNDGTSGGDGTVEEGGSNNGNNGTVNNNYITDLSEVNVNGVILKPEPSEKPRCYTVYGYNGDSTDVVIPESYSGFPVSVIWTMNANTNIRTVTIPGSVTQILDHAFQGCSALEEIHIPKSVTVIGKGAFSGCSSLRNLTVPFVGNRLDVGENDLAYPLGYIFGTNSYDGGIAVNQFYAPAVAINTGYLGGQYVREDETYYIPSSLTDVTVTGGTLYHGAFYDCSMIKAITLSDEVDRIGMSAFSRCSALETITLGNGITTIGSGAFENCTSLQGVYIKDLDAWQRIEFLGNNLATNPLYYAKKLYLNGELYSDSDAQ